MCGVEKPNKATIRINDYVMTSAELNVLLIGNRNCERGKGKSDTWIRNMAVEFARRQLDRY